MQTEKLTHPIVKAALMALDKADNPAQHKIHRLEIGQADY